MTAFRGASEACGPFMNQAGWQGKSPARVLAGPAFPRYARFPPAIFCTVEVSTPNVRTRGIEWT
jgi:hypothetical protein